MATMIGRDRELALLIDRWRKSQAGQGQMVVLTGEAGIGKSRLVEALVAAAGRRGLVPHLGVADAIERKTPYFAFREVFDAIVGLDEASSDAERRDRARRWFASWRPV